MKNIFYIVIGIMVGVILQNFVVYVNAQTSYCDSELWIFLLNNDLNRLVDCVNMPDLIQDSRIELIENKTRIIESTIGLNNTVITK